MSQYSFRMWPENKIVELAERKIQVVAEIHEAVLLCCETVLFWINVS